MAMASRAGALRLWRATRTLATRTLATRTVTSSAARESCTTSQPFASSQFCRSVGLEFRNGFIDGTAFRRYASTATSANSKPMEEVAEGITLTDNCIRRIQEIKLEDGPEGENKMLRLSVEGGGCSGFLYNFALDDRVNRDDRVFERDGAKLVVDDISFGFIKGATVDFTEELIRASFAVTINPNASSACGCGASFNAK